MPRHDRKAYETLTARMPQALVDQARHYASQHGTTVAELLREGLERRLEAEVRPEVRPECAALLEALEPRIQAWLQAAIHQTAASVIPEVRPEVRHKVRPQSPKAGDGQTRGKTTAAPVAPVDYDASKFYLGKLCPRGHAYGTTGMSLLRKANNNCPHCQNQLRRERRAQRQAAPHSG